MEKNREEISIAGKNERLKGFGTRVQTSANILCRVDSQLRPTFASDGGRLNHPS